MAKQRKSLRFELRLAPEEYRQLRELAGQLGDGKMSRAIVALITDRNRGASPPSLDTNRGKAKSHAEPGQVTVAFLG